MAEPHIGVNIRMRGPMTEKLQDRLPYQTPVLRTYGHAVDVIKTINNNMNKNDAIQGQNSLKT